MNPKDLCPCGSEQTLDVCCLPVVKGQRKAETAEQLLRSRYTAFVLGEVDYILGTHHSETRSQVKREEIEQWSKDSEWQGLEILQKAEGEAKDSVGKILFKAKYHLEGKDQEHTELSEFRRDNGAWRFYDGQGVHTGPIRREGPKIGRNDPCPCGSGKKSKKCCTAAA